jgi:type III restriction enzyme
MAMKIKFDPNQIHQKRAWEAVCSVFEGQELCKSAFSMPSIKDGGLLDALWSNQTDKTLTRKKSLKQIIDLENEISVLKSDLKKETQFNRKVELNVEIKNKIEAIKKLEQNL